MKNSLAPRSPLLLMGAAILGTGLLTACGPRPEDSPPPAAPGHVDSAPVDTLPPPADPAMPPPTDPNAPPVDDSAMPPPANPNLPETTPPPTRDGTPPSAG